MHRINLLVAVAGLLVAGCAQNASTPDGSETVTANRPVETGEGTTATENATEVEGESTPAEIPAEPEAAQAETGAERVERELEEAGAAIADWSAETKAELVAKAEQGLAKIDEQIAKLEAQTENLTAEAKAEWEEDKQQLQQKREEFVAQVEQLKNSSEDSWAIFADGLSKAYTDLTEACKESAREFAREEQEPEPQE